jgi:hypothetical protein
MPRNLISLDEFRADFRAGRAPSAAAVQRLAVAEPAAIRRRLEEGPVVLQRR